MARNKNMNLQIRQLTLQQGRTTYENCIQYHHLDSKYVADVDYDGYNESLEFHLVRASKSKSRNGDVYTDITIDRKLFDRLIAVYTQKRIDSPGEFK